MHAYNLDQPLMAAAPMEDSLVDVVVMHLILNKISQDRQQRRMQKSLTEWLANAHSVSQSHREVEADDSSRN